jgi:hypothetical protein
LLPYKTTLACGLEMAGAQDDFEPSNGKTHVVKVRDIDQLPSDRPPTAPEAVDA